MEIGSRRVRVVGKWSYRDRRARTRLGAMPPTIPRWWHGSWRQTYVERADQTDEGRHDAAHAFRNGMIEGRQALMVRRFRVADAIFAVGFAL